jgi:hypothetical protein
VKLKKFGKGGLTELAQKDENRERFRKEEKNTGGQYE